MAFDYLSSQERERLRQLPFPVALPGDLPAGWSALPAEVFQEPDEQDGCGVQIAFQGPGSARLVLTTTSGGIGDPIAGETNHRSKLFPQAEFGEIFVNFWTEDGEQILSDWFPQSDEASFFHSFRGTNIPEQELAGLIDRLTLLDG